MFLRLYLFSRSILFHFHLLHDASSRSMGYLNRVKMDFSFLAKTYLEKWSARTLSFTCTILFLIGSWCLRACDYRNDLTHFSIGDSMWLFIITFATVGEFFYSKLFELRKMKTRILHWSLWRHISLDECRTRFDHEQNVFRFPHEQLNFCFKLLLLWLVFLE